MPSLSTGAASKLDGHLVSVRRELLRSGRSAEEVALILESIREQAMDLVDRDAVYTIDEDGMDSTIARLAAPENYGFPAPAEKPHGSSPSSSTTDRRIGWLSVMAALAGIVLSTIATAIESGLHPRGEPEWGGAVFLVFELIAIVAGLFSRRTRIGRLGLVVSSLILALALLANLIDNTS